MNEYLSPFKENLNKSKHLSTSKKASQKIIRFSRIHNLDIYSDSQKHKYSCLLSDRFLCKSPEPFELQKIFFPLLASLFEDLSDRKGIFQIGA